MLFHEQGILYMSEQNRKLISRLLRERELEMNLLEGLNGLRFVPAFTMNT